MILKTAYLEIKDPSEDCPFKHAEIHFSNDTKCPIYSKSDGYFVTQRAKELSLISDIELMVLDGDIKKSDLPPRRTGPVTPEVSGPVHVSPTNT